VTELRILVVEDRPADAELVLEALRRGGLAVEATIVDSEAAFTAEIGSGIDLVLADYAMPRFGALAALRILKDRALDIPLVIVSGTISEEIAVECMRLGAADYLLKDRLGRLATAVGQAIERRDSERDRRSAEAAARERDELLRAVYESSTDAILVADSARRYVDANGAAVELLGLSRDEILSRRIDDVFWPSAPDAVRTLWPDFLATGEQSGQLTLLRPDGTAREVEYRARANVLSGRHLSVLRDVTEQRRLEDQLQQAQKMEAIGRLAGGIAHDFNNLLTAIIGYAELLEDGLRPADPRQEEVAAIRSAADRAAALTGQLLAFGRRQLLRIQVVDLTEVVREIESLLRRILGEQLTLRTHLDPATGRVRADPSQLEQVVMNLAVNARDAMTGGGDLTIETSNVELDETYARAHLDVTPGRYVLLAVSDTGHGMDAQTRSRLFEPFFTTKAQGQGTGLGLATVYGIVKQSGGHIWVYSEPGQGTTFKIYLPYVDETAEPLPARPLDEPAERGHETVLVVEDDESVRGLIVLVLGRLGYTVAASADPEQALLLARDLSSLDILLSDVVLPKMSGRDLAARVLAMHPGAGVLYVSGYTENAIVHHGVIDPGVPFLQKPFTPQALAARVRGVLEGRP
jgi:PAS domain S-box-containing protein